MILHLLIVKKFVDYAVEQFEAVAPGQNKYLLIDNPRGNDHTSIANSEKVDLVQYDGEEYRKVMQEIGSYDGVVLHSLHKYYFKLVNAIPENLPVTWIIFGTEIYNSFSKLFLSSLLPKTKRLYFKPTAQIKASVNSYYQLLIEKPKAEKQILRFGEKINFIALGQQHTFDFLKTQGFEAKYLDFIFYSLDKTIGAKLKDRVVKGNNILIGNSGSYTNNHLDAFARLKDIPLDGRKIIAPLSYGDKKVIETVKRSGRKIWGDAFQPLTTFQSREKYNESILSCGVVIMNHLRPEGRGNIFTALWLGAKLYINEDTIFFKQFKSEGLIFESIQKKLNSENPDVFKPLSRDEVESNRSVLRKIYSDEVILEQRKLMLSEMEKYQASNQ